MDSNSYGNNADNASSTASSNVNSGTKPGHHPVKKRGMPCVTKCQQCNGSGIIFIGGSKNNKINNTEKTFQCNICDGTFSRFAEILFLLIFVRLNNRENLKYFIIDIQVYGLIKDCIREINHLNVFVVVSALLRLHILRIIIEFTQGKNHLNATLAECNFRSLLILKIMNGYIAGNGHTNARLVPLRN